MNDRPDEQAACPECGSWERQCINDEPVKGCGCQRCLRAALAEAQQERDHMIEQHAQALQKLERIKELARPEHDLVMSIVKHLGEIGEVNPKNANVTGAIHGVIDGYVSWRASAKAVERELAEARQEKKKLEKWTKVVELEDVLAENRHDSVSTALRLYEAVASLRLELAQSRQEIERLRAEIREWICLGCRTVYPGPPQSGFKCVICPKCGGDTRHHGPVKAAAAQRQRDAARLRKSADELDGTSRVNSNIARILREEAADIEEEAAAIERGEE